MQDATNLPAEQKRLSRFFSRLFRSKPKAPEADRRRRLIFEPLEGRILLSTADSSLAPGAPVAAIMVPWKSAPPAGGGNAGVQPAAQEAIAWGSNSDGFWDDPANWIGGVVPGANDDVTIDRGPANPVITIRTPVAVKSLATQEKLIANNSLTVGEASTIAGDFQLTGDLEANGPLTLAGATTWLGGSILGTAKVTNTGTITTGVNNVFLFTDLDNAGTVNLSAGTLSIAAGKTLTNLATHVMNLSGTAITGGAGPLTNNGILNITGGTPTSGYLLNTGTVNVDAGTYLLFGIGTSSGIFDVDAGAIMSFEQGTGGGTFNLNPGALLNGAGEYKLTSFGKVTLNDPTVEIKPKFLHFDEFSNMTGTGKLTVTSGSLFEFHGGSYNSTGPLLVENGGTLDMVDRQFGQSISGTTLTNHGTWTITTTNFSVFQGGTVVNQTDGVLHLVGQVNIFGPGGSTFNNLGLIDVNSAGKTATNALAMNQAGTIHSIAGTISLSGTLTSSGTFNVDAGAALAFSAAFVNNEMTPGTQWLGAGQYILSFNCSVNIDANVSLTVADLHFNGGRGALGGAGDLTIASGGSFTLPGGGGLSGTGATIISSGATMTGTVLTIDTRPLTNRGTVSLSEVGTNGSAQPLIQNQAGATFTVSPAVGTVYSRIQGVDFENDGTLNLTGGSQGSSFSGILNNRGAFNVAGGNVVTFTTTSGASTGTFQVAANTTLFFQTNYTFNAGTQFTGAGRYQFYILGNYTLAAGVVLNAQQADLSGFFSGAGSIAIPSGGVWTGSFPEIDSLGGFTIGTGASLTLSSEIIFDHVSPTNNGLLVIGANTSQLVLRNASVFTNAATGEVRFAPDSNGSSSGILDSSTLGNGFINQGLLRRTGGTGRFYLSGVAFTNPGTIETDAGRFVVATFNLPQLSADDTQLIGGTWRVLNGASLSIDVIARGNNHVTVVENDADVTLSGAGSTFNAVNNLTENHGRLALLKGASLDILLLDTGTGSASPGPLDNTGTIEVGAGSMLRVGTDFTQTAAGALIVHLASVASSGEVTVGGTANLGGSLQVLLDGGFLPATGDTFDLLTDAARSGSFANVSGVQPLFAPTAAATFYRIKAIGDAANLAPTSLTGNGGANGDSIVLSYSVTNSSTFATNASSWTDSFYLSTSATFDFAQATLLGRKVHSGALAGGGIYSDSATFTIPTVAPGSYYLYVVTDSRGEVADQGRANNVFRGPSVTITTPTLTLGTSVNGTAQSGESKLYKVTLPAGVTRIQLRSLSGNGAAELYVRAGAAPTLAQADAYAFDVTDQFQTILLNIATAGDYYILVRGTALATGVGTFQLIAQVPAFALDDASPTAGTNNGEVTLTLRGAQFTANTTVTLRSLGGTNIILTPPHLVLGDASTIYATFNLTGVAPGTFDIVATDGAHTSAIPSGFEVLQAPVVDSGATVSLTFTAPTRGRVGRPINLFVTVVNATGHDVPAPYLELTTDNGQFQLPGHDEYVQDFVEFYVTNPNGAPGTLPPGFRTSYLVSFKPINGAAGDHSSITLSGIDQTAPLDLEKLETEARTPDQDTDAEWAVIQAQLLTQVGPTQGDYERALRADMDALPAELGEVSSPLDLLQLEVLKARAAVTTSLTGRATTSDAAVHLGGQLVFADNLDTSETFETILLNDGTFRFTDLSPGSYALHADAALNTDTTTFTVTGGQHRTGATMTLIAGESLTGLVSANGQPLADATVIATADDGTIFVGVSDATGAYRIAGLPQGNFTITADGEGRARTVLTNVAIGVGGAVQNFPLAPEATITGSVLLGIGFPGDAQTIVLAQVPGNTDSANVYLADFDVAGGFVIHHLPAGTYDLEISRDGYSDLERTSITVGAGGTVSAGSFTLGALGSISGTITSTDAAFSSHLLVGAYAGNDLISVAMADATGLFTLTDLPAGAYSIQSLNLASFATTAQVTLTAGEAATGVAIALAPGGQITGSVTIGGVPTANLPVFATEADGTRLVALTDPTGAYAFSHLPIGSYALSLGLTGAGASGSATITSLTGAGSTAVLNLAPTISTRITGTLRLADNSPAGLGSVTLLENGVPVASGAAQADGTFTIFLQRGGTFELRAVAGNASFAPVTGLVVADGGSLQENLTAGSSTLTVTVSDATMPTVGSRVLIAQLSTGLVLGSQVVGASGQVSFANLVPGDYGLSVSNANGRGGQLKAAVAAGVNSGTLPQGALVTVSGTITAPGGIAPDATLTAQSTTQPGLSYSVPINPDGTYSLSGLTPGSYDLVALSAGNLTNVASNVTIADTTLYNLTLTDSGTTSLTGTVVDPAGLPIEGAIVVALDPQQHVIGQAKTGVNGKFVIDSATGMITLRVSLPGVDPFGVFSQFDASLLLADDEEDVGNLTSAAFAQVQRPNLPPLPGLLQLVLPDNLYDKLVEKATNFARAKNHVFTNFKEKNPDCVNCNQERKDGITAKKAQDAAYDDADKKHVELFKKAESAKLAVVHETDNNVLLLEKIAAITVGSYIVLQGIEAGLAGEVSGVLIDIVQSVIEAQQKAQETLDPQDEPQTSKDKILELINKGADTAAKTTTAIDFISLLLTREAPKGTGPVKILTDIITQLTDFKKSIKSLNFEDSQKKLSELIVADKDFDKADKKYREKTVPPAKKAEQAFYKCLKESSANPNCNPNGPKKNKPQKPRPPGPLAGAISAIVNFANSLDPNDISGPAGVGPEQFVGAQTPLSYTIDFENQSTASASAAEVTITQQLDPNLDLSTFRFTGFGFGGEHVAIDTNLASFHQELDLRDTRGILLDVDAELNLQTGLLTWTFKSIDPLTGDVTGDAALGFLPPNVDGTEGQGFVSYSVQAKASAPTGSPISAQASIVFDSNPAIMTASISNTLDAVAPTVHVAALPAIVGPDFTLNWAGSTDDLGGSGIASYDLFVSDNNGAFATLVLGTTHTAYVFAGAIGHAYKFVVAARDLAGNQEALPNVADVSVTVAAATQLTFNAARPLSFNDQNGDKVTVKLTGLGSGTVTLVNGVGSSADLRTLVLTGTTAATTLSITVAKANGGTGTTNVGRITSLTALGTLTLGPGVILGDGLDDLTTDLTLANTVRTLALSDIAGFAKVELGAGLNAAAAATLKPTFTAGRVLGQDVSINVHGGLGLTTIKSWNQFGFLTTEQSVAGITVTSGDFNANVDLDSFNHAIGTATMGALNISAGKLLSTSFFVEGKFTSLTASGGVYSEIHASGIGNVTAGFFENASILVGAGGVGNVTATKGSMLGTTITSTGGKIGNLTVNLLKQTGDVPAMTGVVVSGTQIGNITASVSGLATLGTGLAIGGSQFTATAGSIGNITATAKSLSGDSFLVGIGGSSFLASQKIGNITATAQATSASTTPPPSGAGLALGLVGGSGGVEFQAGTSIGTVKVTAAGAKGDNVGVGNGVGGPVRLDAGTTLGAVTISASKGRPAASTSRATDGIVIVAGGSVGLLTISGNATTDQASNVNLYAGGSLAGVNISSTDQRHGSLVNSVILAGQLVPLAKNTDLAKASIGAITISGSFIDTTGTQAATIAARGNLGAITIGGNLSEVSLAAGFNAGADHAVYSNDDSFNRAGQIASVKVVGALINASIVAGVSPGTDQYWGQDMDPTGTALAGVTQLSKIGAITLGATTVLPAATKALQTPAVFNHHSAIESFSITSLKIGKLPTLTNFNTAGWIDANGDGNEDLTETVVRKISG